MIPFNTELHLGRKALAIFIYRRAAAALVFLLAAALLLAFGADITKSGAGALSVAGAPNGATIVNLSWIMSYLIAGLLVLSVVVFLLGVLIAFIEYRNYSYLLDEFDLKMKRGVITRRETSIPYRSIQDVNIHRGLGYQILGLSRLVMQTAGRENYIEHGTAEVILEPIDRDAAEEIRTLLERKVGVQVTEDEKVADVEAHTGDKE